MEALFIYLSWNLAKKNYSYFLVLQLWPIQRVMVINMEATSKKGQVTETDE